MSDISPRAGRWGQERRLEFIDFRLLWEGRLNRSDLTNFFKISIPQASLDLSRYQEIAPQNMDYDRTQKTYVATENFEPALNRPDSTQYLNELLWRNSGTVAHSDSFVGWSPQVDTLPFPNRNADINVMLALLRAIQQQAVIVIGYQSMEHPLPEDRQIFPRAFAFDGFRWHLRAFCLRSEKHKDFVLGRIYSTGEVFDPISEIPEDNDWNTFVTLVIGPNPNYSEPRRQAIERDYQMVNGQAVIKTRRALLFYLKKRLNLGAPGQEAADHQQIVLLKEE